MAEKKDSGLQRDQLMFDESKFENLLNEYDFVVIPSTNVHEIFQDELGFVRIRVGCSNRNLPDGDMMYFLNRDSIVNGGLNQKTFSNFHRGDIKHQIKEEESYGE